MLPKPKTPCSVLCSLVKIAARQREAALRGSNGPDIFSGSGQAVDAFALPVILQGPACALDSLQLSAYVRWSGLQGVCGTARAFFSAIAYR